MKARKAEKKEGSSGQPLSRISVHEYLPALRRIFSVIEIGNDSHPDPDRLQDLHLFFLREELDGTQYDHAMDIIAAWLKGSRFASDFARIWKLEPSATWQELTDLLTQRMAEDGNDVTVIELTLHPTGKMTRIINKTELPCDFTNDGLKTSLLRLLAENGGYVPTQDIITHIGSKDLDSLSELKRTTNHAARIDLKLPASYNLIDSKKGSGYRIHPLYNLVVI